MTGLRSAAPVYARSIERCARVRPPRAHRNGVGVPLRRRLRSRNWDRHVEHVEALAQSGGFVTLRDRILNLAELRPGDRLLDVGAGTGLLALAAAPRVSHAVALDSSRAMCECLEHNRLRLGVWNLDTVKAPATAIPLADEALDVVVSNYCFHHLDQTEKELALLEIKRVLRPGGRFVFAGMMFDIGILRRRDRTVRAQVSWRLLRRGPLGIVRLLKNAVRLALGGGEHPAGVDWWRGAIQRAGFADTVVEALDNEGGIARARR